MRKSIVYVNATAMHGGAEEVLVHIMATAQDIGYQPVLVVPGNGWLVSACQQRGIPCEVVPTIPVTSATTHWRQRLLPWMPSALRVARIARKWRAVLVHSNSPRVSYIGGLAARFAGAAAVTHAHDIYGLPFASAPQARLLAALADLFVVPSDAVAQAITSYVPRLRPRIQTLYNGWDLSLYSDVTAADVRTLFGLSPSTVVVGNVAAMHPWKGQDVLIEAFGQLRRRRPDVHLVIVGGSHGAVGESAYEASLRQRVADSGLDGAVTFTGWREDVWSLMKGFDVFVHVPTQPDPLPTAVLHAAALKGAIVAASIGGIPEIIEDGEGGMLVPPRDAERLCDVLDALISDPQLRGRLGERAQAHFLRRFSHSQLEQGLAKAYQRCLRAGASEGRV